ncbi:MAG: hypothetical protein K2Y51_26140 [Gammaproteobacteria bacterium]|nr:hypothetical protein [Gammaproteobacteria bacterium]
MAEIYGHKWTSAYGYEDADGTWAKGLADMSSDELKAGFIACVTRDDSWPPSLPEFRALCRPPKSQREHAAMYRLPPERQLPHLLTDEQRAAGRAHVAAAKRVLMP